MKLLYKFLLLLAIPWLFQLLLFGILFKGQMQASEAEVMALHTKRVLSQANDLLPPVLLQAAHLRGAIITGDVSTLGDAATWNEITAGVDLLRVLVSDNPQQVERVDKLREDVIAFRAWVDENRILILQNQREELVKRFDAPTAKKVADRFRTQLRTFLAEEERLDRIRIDELMRVQVQQRTLLIVAVIGSLLTAAVAVFAFSRSIGSRLATLTLNAQRLADGAPLARKLGGKDEISLLDEVLHQTSLRLAEAEIMASRHRLELEARAIELAIVNESLRQQTQENEMFIYSVSHDLRSPLVNLQGFSKEIMHACNDLQAVVTESSCSEGDRKRFNDIIKNDMAEALRFLQTAVLRTSNIIDALLRLSRAGRVEYQLQEVDVNQIVARVVDAMYGTIRERGVAMTIHPLPSAWADPTAVEQIFGNLIGNAVCYLDPNRTGSIEIGSTEIDSTSGSVTFYVKDNGLGIPAAYLPKMFTAFQRFHGNVAKGEGIGLALVRRSVERHGGRIWVESTQNVGTTIFLSLPGEESDSTMHQHQEN
ncbi:MAG: CHASE3 domain-containing protein [Herminiimonas sp.]|nr:CHASE3 domain-containing protein [Herminiimonas sp.]